MVRTFVQMLAVLGLLHMSGVFASAESPTEIDSCGQHRNAKRYVLVADLNCEPGQNGIHLLDGGRLDLNDHSITVSQIAPDWDVAGIYCSVGCKISGPGVVIGGKIGTERNSRVVDVMVTGAPYDGIRGDRLVVKDSMVVDSGEDGIDAIRKVKIKDSVITGSSENGVYTGSRKGRIVVRNSDVTGNNVSGSPCSNAPQCADLSSANEPRIGGSTQCGFWYNWLYPALTDLCAPN